MSKGSNSNIIITGMEVLAMKYLDIRHWMAIFIRLVLLVIADKILVLRTHSGTVYSRLAAQDHANRKSQLDCWGGSGKFSSSL